MSILLLWQNLLWPFLFFASNVIFHMINLGKSVYVFTDEGVYLYAAKLLGQGLIPYKDFFLAHPPYLLYPTQAILSVTNFNLNFFHFLYTVWFFGAIFPLYFVILKLTKSFLATILSIILFSTFAELVQWDAHFFALRQASMPLLIFSLYFIFVKQKSKVAGLLLGIFALSLVSNLLISLCLIIALYFSKPWSFKPKSFLATFSLIAILGYLLIMLIPNGFSNIISYQSSRPFVPYTTRLEWIKNYLLANNWPILLLGLAGTIVVRKKWLWLIFFNILSMVAVIFVGPSFYPHYVTSLAIGFTLSSGVLISLFKHSIYQKILISAAVLTSICLASYNHLKYHLLDNKTPGFFQVVDLLKQMPEPIFTFEPIYGLYAKRNLTFHYFASDMRYFRVTGTNLNDLEYLNILTGSNTVLLEQFANSLLTQKSLEYIKDNFILTYHDNEHKIYVRNK